LRYKGGFHSGIRPAGGHGWPDTLKGQSKETPVNRMKTHTSSFVDTGLFHGQSDAFFNALFRLAQQADRAVRECDRD
jgi:hypothetical protein